MIKPNATSQLNIFTALATRVEHAWLKNGNDLVEFTDIATDALKQFNYDWSLETLEDEIRQWLLNNTELPHQMSVHNTFGQPSVTLFNNGRFVVDLYFWVDFDTSIHSHGFRGAFRLLHGESLQETFHTSTLQIISEDVRIVDLSKVDFVRLKKNDTQTIAPGTDLTHRVIHLVNPTVTLCLKTINEPELKQWNYLSTGLAVQRQNLSDDLLKKIYFYQYLLIRDDLAADQFLEVFLGGLNISTQIHLYEAVASGGLDLTDKTVDRITEKIVTLHEESTWWPAYEKAHLDSQNDISFEDLQNPQERLAAHFKNCGYDIANCPKIDDTPG